MLRKLPCPCRTLYSTAVWDTVAIKQNALGARRIAHSVSKNRDVFGRAFQKDPPARTRQRVSLLPVETEPNRVPGCPAQDSNQAALLGRYQKTLLRRPPSRVANSALSASPEPLAFPLQTHPWDLCRNNPRPRKNKGENPHQNFFRGAVFDWSKRGKAALGAGLPALPLVKMAALGGAAPSGNPRVAPPTRAIHAEPSTPAVA